MDYKMLYAVVLAMQGSRAKFMDSPCYFVIITVNMRERARSLAFVRYTFKWSADDEEPLICVFFFSLGISFDDSAINGGNHSIE